MKLVEQRSISYSVILHVAAALLLLVGIPVLLPTPPEPTPMVMSVELLPISEMSNVKPSNEPIREAKHAPAPPKPVKPVTPPPQPPEKPKTAPDKPTEPVKTEPKPFDPTEGAEPVKDKPKPKEEKKPEKPQESDFDKMMRELKENEKKTTETKPADKTPPKAAPAETPGKDKTNVAENKTKSDAPYDASLPLSISEKDMIRSQFIPCWRAPMGAKDAGSLAVRVKVELAQDAVVKTAVVAPDQMGRYNSDVVFRAAADAAVRAVHKCSPLKGMPADKYGTWSNMEINFDPKDMM